MPQDAGMRCNLGTAYLAVGRYNDAVAQLQQALRLNPGLTQARANLAEAERASASPARAPGPLPR